MWKLNRWLSSIFADTILYKLVFMEKLQPNLFFPLAGVAAVASFASCSNKQKPVEQKPLNIVYIMTDDHTAQMMSCYDTRYMETPNLDRIAADGVRFTQSFVANSLSGPSRACMIRVNIVVLINSMIIPLAYSTVRNRLFRSCCRKSVIRQHW